MKIKSIVLSFLTLLILFIPSLTLAQNQNRDYRYGDIIVDYKVNKDTTVDVLETQQYIFTGEYHEGWRSISTKGTLNIDNIYVEDEDGTRYSYSPVPLNKYDTSSWGKFTIKERPGYLDVIWYYKAKDESRKWVIGYKLHGAVSFLLNKDEFYWNVVDEYTKPIGRVIVGVTVPENEYGTSSFPVWIYGEGAQNIVALTEWNKQGSFFATDIIPYGKVTVAYGWPKGIIDRGAFWREWFSINRYYAYGIIQLIFVLLFMFVFWYFTEKRKEKFVIVSEYEPPKGITPAMADIILHEKITKRTWPATVVDLAVRGYLKIEEKSNGYKISKKVARVIFRIFFVAGFVYMYWIKDGVGGYIAVILTSIIVYLFAKNIISSDYSIHKLKDFEDPGLKPYEVGLLKAMYSVFVDTFSTKRAATSAWISKILFERMKVVEKRFYKELSEELKPFYDTSVGVMNRKPKIKIVYSVGSVFIGLFILFGINYLSYLNASNIILDTSVVPLIFFAISIIISSRLLINFFFLNPKLSDAGREVKRKLLGFKMFLEVTESNRFAKLDEKSFSEYLPYAIVFKVEKKWAKKFESVSMKDPSWYTSSNTGIYYHTHSSFYTGGATSMSSVGAFSPISFSNSFTSSFVTAFSSSGASGSSGGGGGSGGGGSAGGGGGGGGGGAS